MFDVLLVDIYNPKDNISIEQQLVPESCTRRSVAGDYMRYHYNGTFLNGLTFDTRWEQDRLMTKMTASHERIDRVSVLSPATRGTARTTPTSGWGT